MEKVFSKKKYRNLFTDHVFCSWVCCGSYNTNFLEFKLPTKFIYLWRQVFGNEEKNKQSAKSLNKQISFSVSKS